MSVLIRRLVTPVGILSFWVVCASVTITADSWYWWPAAPLAASAATLWAIAVRRRHRAGSGTRHRSRANRRHLPPGSPLVSG